ncbi:Hypothetical protein, putative [Bodo saltans]|uniref:Uncharacterized protein n=1 Tax=Bodo saltans TaxID=75058 RepID=A0A0S4JNG1_BODSA|nr:Hypothetical protein, putative [Bodo saltans]|eukprot:CUG91677.1 Hypothetical protein, putative [Bodo saltans]
MRGGRDYDQLKGDLMLTQSIFRLFDEKGDAYDKLGYHAGWPSGFPEEWFLEFRCYNNTDIAGEILTVATAADEERKAKLKKAEASQSQCNDGIVFLLFLFMFSPKKYRSMKSGSKNSLM